MNAINLKDVPPERIELLARLLVDAIHERVAETLFHRTLAVLSGSLTIGARDNFDFDYKVHTSGANIIAFLSGKCDMIHFEDSRPDGYSTNYDYDRECEEYRKGKLAEEPVYEKKR